MDTIIVQKEGSLTHFIASDGSVLYSMFDEYQTDGWWSSMVQRIAPVDSEKPDVNLASVSYIDYGTTTVRFGSRMLDLDSFLRRQDPYSNSRQFVALDGQAYVWIVNGRTLELRHADLHTLIARSRPSKRPTLLNRKSCPASIEVLHKYANFKDDTLQMLDTIIVTYSIMQRKLNDRLKYRYPC